MTGPELFARLLAVHGRFTGWWPSDSDFETAIGAILVQGVAWRNAQRAVARLKQAGLCTPAELSRAARPEVAECLRPALYHNQKARYVQDFADWVEGDLGGDLQALGALGVDAAQRLLMERRGIGAETAAAIAVYALRLPAPVVDAYALRVLRRCGVLGEDAPAGDVRPILANAIGGSPERAQDLHAAIVAHAQRHCRRTPLCDDCPLRADCPRRLGNTAPGRWGRDGSGRGKTAAQKRGDRRGATYAPVERRGGTRTRALG